MKTAAPPENEPSLNNLELEIRLRARKVISEVFSDLTDLRINPTIALIENVAKEIIITDDDGTLDESSISEEIENFKQARVWAKQAYGDDSPGATVTAYEVLFGMTNEDRWNEVNEKLDEMAPKSRR